MGAEHREGMTMEILTINELAALLKMTKPANLYDVRDANTHWCDEGPPIACVEDQRQFALQES